jgi:AcrR family transcriptional regulator
MRNTRADVVAAALRVLDGHGLEFCSMRRVAAALEVQPSALYHHVPDKQTLLALMADEIVRGVGVGARDPRQFCLELRGALLAVRDGADVVATATAFRVGSSHIEDRLTALVGADGARTLLLYTFGQAQSTQTHRQAAAFGALLGAGGGPDPAPRAGVAAVENSGPGAGVGGRGGADPASGTGAGLDVGADLDASYERGLDIILAGLAV